MSNKNCFTCSVSGSLDCPNVAIDVYDDRFGYPAAEDLGFHSISCSECYHHTLQCVDCLFFDSDYCERRFNSIG